MRSLSRVLVIPYSEGLRPSDSPARALARRFDGSLRSRGSLARSLATVLSDAEIYEMGSSQSHGRTQNNTDTDRNSFFRGLFCLWPVYPCSSLALFCGISASVRGSRRPSKYLSMMR